ncbi:hypothetical protein [Microlunatus soli]|nr:hypothetical protein [Microlunatus soli]
MTGAPAADAERGQAISVLAMGIVAMLIMVAGLVIDGGQKAAAISRAESAAAGAARAAANAGAGGTLGTGGDRSVAISRARTAALNYLRGVGGGTGPRVSGTVTVDGAEVHVHTSVTVTTIFLSLIGIDTLSAAGDATARVVPT